MFRYISEDKRFFLVPVTCLLPIIRCDSNLLTFYSQRSTLSQFFNLESINDFNVNGDKSVDENLVRPIIEQHFHVVLSIMLYN